MQPRCRYANDRLPSASSSQDFHADVVCGAHVVVQGIAYSTRTPSSPATTQLSHTAAANADSAQPGCQRSLPLDGRCPRCVGIHTRRRRFRAAPGPAPSHHLDPHSLSPPLPSPSPPPGVWRRWDPRCAHAHLRNPVRCAQRLRRAAGRLSAYCWLPSLSPRCRLYWI